MSEYWKSTPKHYCEICKLWLSGHPRNVETHERSEAHVAKKDKLLQRMEQTRREKERTDAETFAAIRAIEAEARAAMKKGGPTKDPKATLTYALNRAARFAPVHLPPTSSSSDICRPLEEERIRKFIAKATGIDTDNVPSLIAPGDDILRTMLYYPDERAVPEIIKSDKKYLDVRNWRETEDETTGLPLFTNRLMNLSIWEKPGVMATAPPTTVSPETTEPNSLPEQEQGQAPILGTKRQKTSSGIPKGLEAPVLGPWEAVPAAESVFGDNVNPEVRAAQEKAPSTEERLAEFFENAGNRPDRSTTLVDTLAEADMELIQPGQRLAVMAKETSSTQCTTSVEKPDEGKKPMFKKRVRTS